MHADTTLPRLCDPRIYAIQRQNLHAEESKVTIAGQTEVTQSQRIISVRFRRSRVYTL